MIDPWMSSLKTEQIYVEDETLEFHNPRPFSAVKGTVTDNSLAIAGEGFDTVAVMKADDDSRV